LASLDLQLRMLEPTYKEGKWALPTKTPSLADVSLYYQLRWGIDIAAGKGVLKTVARMGMLWGRCSTERDIQGSGGGFTLLKRISTLSQYPEYDPGIGYAMEVDSSPEALVERREHVGASGS
jgi:hypothetical protein